MSGHQSRPAPDPVGDARSPDTSTAGVSGETGRYRFGGDCRICPTCNGSGEVGRYTDRICPRCQGRGDL